MMMDMHAGMSYLEFWKGFASHIRYPFVSTHMRQILGLKKWLCRCRSSPFSEAFGRKNKFVL